MNRKNKLLKAREDISSQKGHPILWFDTSSILFFFFVCPRFFCFIASPVQPIFLGFSHFKNLKFPSQLFFVLCRFLNDVTKIFKTHKLKRFFLFSFFTLRQLTKQIPWNNSFVFFCLGVCPNLQLGTGKDYWPFYVVVVPFLETVSNEQNAFFCFSSPDNKNSTRIFICF